MATKHHWVGKKPSPETAFGFLYEITCLDTGRQYLGRKQYHKYRKRNKVGDNDWHAYTGSSKDLNEDIRRLGKHLFKFRLLRNLLTRGGLVYAEANLLHRRDVLTRRLTDADDSPHHYYNKQIGAIKFIPREW
jgi:hypothetical protein